MSDSTVIHPGVADILPPAQPLAELLASLVLDYARRDGRLSLNDWLADTLTQRAGVDRAAALDTASQLLVYLEDSHSLRQDLRQHLDKGKSRSSWIARQVEQIARNTQSAPAEVAALGELLTGKALVSGEPVTLPDWNEMSRIALAKGIEQQNLLQVASDVVADGARQWAGQSISGLLKDHPDSARLAQQFIAGELDLGSRAGLQATLAAGTEIAVRRGLLGPELKRALDDGVLIPAWFAHQTFIGTENASLLHAAGTGQLDPAEALDQMVDVATAAVTQTTREVCERVGGQIGQAIALKVPVVGAFLAPVASQVGEMVGTAVGVVAGSVAGAAIKKGVEVVTKVATKVVSGVTKAAQKVASLLSFGLLA
ncbi:hypothetical protein C6P61_00340 [Malikia spinosa]|uniref:Uncharacterized protein n=1 Tax=Malikia spinosa TaxID=86180 RepID=A0A2S9KJE3_9BURK|nr:hypothetical protein [Malikia spinosa]PRD70568.1 hypothetical protein C6P61_00340 [Malikia spinosa]